ncbi:MAG TPA: divergent polysaccharide deacetylase family protein [Gammaproteobacteria bacterium]|nr:divergent polysaccharide deacetylase family protein [Gammaproteobacteria bacterium]
MKWRTRILAIALLGSAAGLHAQNPPSAGSVSMPVIAIIIDDLGNSLEEGQQTTALPGPVACSILPHTKFSRPIAELVHANGKEVLLHLPMESVSELPLGPGGITLDMTQKEIQDTVRGDLASIPHRVGVNNHEGSLITQHPGDMAWIMQVLAQFPGLFYVDSYTSVNSVAYGIARENGVPAARRSVFLDDTNTEAAVQFQFRRLLKRAHKEGFALAIGHPRPATLAVLAHELPTLASRGVRLVPVSEIVKLQQAHPLQLPADLFPRAVSSRR